MVEDTFQVTGRGLVLVPGLNDTSPSVRVGDGITLKTPENKVIQSKIAGIEMIRYYKIPKQKLRPILLPKEIRKEDVPIGTYVHLTNDDET